MLTINNRTTPPLNANSVGSLNRRAVQAVNCQNVLSLNRRGPVEPVSPPPEPARNPIVGMRSPRLSNLLRTGQKTPLGSGGVRQIEVCFGWNVADERCDVDASAFLLGDSGKVPDDSYFIFYGQPENHGAALRVNANGMDRENIRIDMLRLGALVHRIVFVLTIHEAFEHNLNFSMLRDAYVRILNCANGQELLSYRVEEYYHTVTSMTLGELYLHNGQWKFNPVGNGVHQDLAGQCAIYGVEIG